jgi:hypothetical protein
MAELTRLLGTAFNGQIFSNLLALSIGGSNDPEVKRVTTIS